MPLDNFDGDTFVAFIDISGFKELMRNENNALRALDEFYGAGYTILFVHSYEASKIDGLFVSDCGILFVRSANQDHLPTLYNLRLILSAVREINRRMREEDIMLTTSIAYGRFRYQKRIEFNGIEKHPVYGNAYVSAFLDNEEGKPKLEPGLCRIMKKGLPDTILNTMQEDNNDDIFRMIKERDGDRNHFYYYWMVNLPTEINEFEHRYRDSYKLKYEGTLRALKGR